MNKLNILALFSIIFYPALLIASPSAPSFSETLINPNLIYLLLLIAIYGVFFEIVTPGGIAPGVIGFLSLLFVLYAFVWMPVNFVALTFLLLGLALMIFEAFINFFGLVGLLGTLAFVWGSLKLFNHPDLQIFWFLIALMTLFSLIFFYLLVHLAVRAYKKKIVTGKEALIGEEGTVIKVHKDHLTVQVVGELWYANSSQHLHVQDSIRVTHVQGLKLTVEPNKK